MKQEKGQFGEPLSFGDRSLDILDRHGVSLATINPLTPYKTAKRLNECFNHCDGGSPEAVPDLVEALRFYVDNDDSYEATHIVNKAKALAALAKWEGK